VRRILVVENQPPVQQLAQILRGGGYDVTTVGDRAAALDQLRTAQFDLILTDIQMPPADGLDLLAAVRSLPAGAAKPRAIVLTSDTKPEMLLRALREQAYQLLHQPVDAGELLDTVASALDAPPGIPPIEVISAKPDWVELVAPCEMSTAERLQSFIAQLDADLADDTRTALSQVFRELLLNAIEWGGEFDPNRKVRVGWLRTRHMVLVRIADPGRGFRFEDLTHAAVGYPPEDRLQYVEARLEKGLRPGGFGILMAQAMVDELIYNEAHNEVVFVKYLDRQKSS
jgi:CheY-like chemotaxis protein/anti-sigma regulatory factor (Ser/Thr protein kinase)